MNVNEYFLELYYSRMDPAGVQEQLLEDAELEQELHNLRKNLAGHLYTFARHRFWKLIGDIPDDLRRRFVEFGLAHAVVDGPFAELSQADYEHLFNIPDQGAFVWQEEYSDEGEEDDLMTLLSLLNELADAKSFFV